MSTVEPVFGTLINFLGIRKVNTRGIQQANKCMLMAATAFNLKKLLTYAQKPPKSCANLMKIATKKKGKSTLLSQPNFRLAYLPFKQLKNLKKLASNPNCQLK